MFGLPAATGVYDITRVTIDFSGFAVITGADGLSWFPAATGL